MGTGTCRQDWRAAMVRWRLDGAVLLLSAVLIYGTQEALGAQDHAQCNLENGLPAGGPKSPWKNQTTYEARKQWLQNNRNHNGPECRNTYAIPYCVLLSSDWTSWLVQAVLMMIGVGSLLLKKHREDVQAARQRLEKRTTRVWSV